jgi:hypothetical protein
VVLPAGGKLPGTFKFEVLKPVARASPPRLDALAAMHGTVATVTGGVQVVSWLPRLPKDQQVMVYDYRFTGEVTNWDTVAYPITNQWSARSGAIARAAANIHALINPPISPPKRDVVTLVRAAFMAALLLPLAVAVGWWLAKKKEQKAS